MLQSQVVQATTIIERKLVEEAANEQAAAAAGDTARAERIAAVRTAWLRSITLWLCVACEPHAAAQAQQAARSRLLKRSGCRARV